MRRKGPSEEIRRVALPERLRVLLVAAVRLAGLHDLDSVLRCVVEDAAAVAGARYAAIGIYGEEGQIVTFVQHGVDARTAGRIGHLPEGRGLLGEVIMADAAIRIDDLSIDSRSCGFPSGHPRMRTFLGVPVVRNGRRYGNLYVTEKRDGGIFDDEDEALIVTLAAFAASAIESAELIEAERGRAHAIVERIAAEEQARARRQLLAQTIAAQESERARVSRDLHDDIGQALTSVLLGLRLVDDSLAAPVVDLDDARRLSSDLRDLVTDALRRTRRLAFDLRPTVLDDVGLAPALERLISDVADRTGLRVELVVGLAPDERLASEIETIIYRVVQEALTNVARHAHASTVSVLVTSLDDRVRALIEDDGQGFDASALPGQDRLGVLGMEERAHLVGGTLAVTSTPGEGTVVVVEVPRE